MADPVLIPYDVTLRINIPADQAVAVSDKVGGTVVVDGLLPHISISGHVQEMRYAGDPLVARRRRQHREDK